jgi:hypothetical protein
MLCDLFEGGCNLGLVALVNSLAASGLQRMDLAGYRGKLPSWTYLLQRSTMKNEYVVTNDILTALVLIGTCIHFTNTKLLAKTTIFGKPN